MSDKYLNKYRIPSARLQGYDYGRNGAYFITICTYDRVPFFGEIENGKMTLNEMGQLAKKFWSEIPNHFPFAELGASVVMPNHIHGILMIDKKNRVDNDNAIDSDSGVVAIPVVFVETRLIASLQKPPQPPSAANKTGGITGKHNPMLQENISRMIRWYKGRCSFEIRKIHADFGWQSRFHDHIIRNDAEYNRIENYIRNNPKNWKEDKFFD